MSAHSLIALSFVTFNMLNIYRGINIYSRIKQLFNILITLCMSAHRRIGMGKLIHKD